MIETKQLTKEEIRKLKLLEIDSTFTALLSESFAQPFYSRVLCHLYDRELCRWAAYVKEDNFSEFVRDKFAGKRVLELGSRDGLFLRFLQRHGAEVRGVTSRVGPPGFRILEESTIYKSINELNQADLEKLKEFAPDYIINVSYLDYNRFQTEQEALKSAASFFTLLKSLATRQSEIILIPACDSSAVIKLADFVENESEEFELGTTGLVLQNFYYNKPYDITDDQANPGEKGYSYSFKFPLPLEPDLRQ